MKGFLSGLPAASFCHFVSDDDDGKEDDDDDDVGDEDECRNCTKLP